MGDTRSRRAVVRSLASLSMLALLDSAFTQAVAQTATRPAAPAEVAAEVPGAQLIGSGRLTFFGLHVYDARLWAAEPFKPADFDKLPLALELEYARTLYGKLIAERSLTEMKRSGDIATDKGERWLATMTQLFPDVAKGDRVVGVQVPGVATHFFHNGKARGEVRDAEFTRLFFGIWLSARTSEPKLRDALLAGAKSTS